MLLAFEETVWSKKYFYWWTVRLHLNFYVHNLKIFMHICLAKISLWSVWRDLREAKTVVNYMKIFKFLWISTQFQKFLRRYGAFLKIFVETRIKIQMFLKCFWLLRKPSDQKNIFIDERFDYIWIFMLIWRFSFLAKISLWSVWRKEALELYENLQILWISTQFQKF